MFNFSFGSDPEFMLKNENGELCSAIDIVKNNKWDRINTSVGEYYYDNVLAECSIPPGNTKNEVIDNFSKCFNKYAKLVKPYKLVPQASADYPASVIRNPEARVSGCEKEWCAYSIIEDSFAPAKIIEKTPFRSGGGHIHLGGGGVLQDEYGKLALVRMLDIFLGIPSLILDQDPTSAARRKLYGQAGRHRIKDYGIEYRTLGNFWLSSPDLVGLIYDICQFVLDFTSKNQNIFFKVSIESENRDDWVKPIHKNYKPEKIQDAIDNSNKISEKFAWKLVDEYMPKKLNNRIKNLSNINRNYDFYKEWNIK